MADMLLTVSGLYVKNNKERTDREWAVENVSFSVERGQILLVYGESKSGKSPLMGAIDYNNSTTFRSDCACYAEDADVKVAHHLGDLKHFGESMEKLGRSSVVIRNGFDMMSEEDWAMIRTVRNAGGTFIADSETRHLQNMKPGYFNAFILITDGKAGLTTEHPVSADPILARA